MIFKRTLISVLVAAAGHSYATAAIETNNQADNGSSWLEENNSINKITIGENGNGNNLINGGTLIPHDNHGANIIDNNVVHIIDTNGLTVNGVFGGYCNGQNDSCAVTNTAVVVDSGSNVGSIYGASSGSVSTVNTNTSSGESYTNKALGSAYLNGSSADTIFGAYTNTNAITDIAGSPWTFSTATNSSTYTNETTGNAHINGGSVNNAVYGAYADAYSLAKASSQAYSNVTANNSASFDNKVTGNVYLNDSTVGVSTYGAFSYSSASTDAYMNVSFNEPATTNNTSTFNNQVTGNVYLTNSSVNGNLYGAASNDSSTVIATTNMIGSSAGKTTNNATITSHVTGNVDINNGTVLGNIYGAQSSVIATTSNFSDVDYPVTHTTTFNITNQGNVSLSGNVTLGPTTEIWGGYLDNNALTTTPVYYQIFKGNTFTMSSNPITVSKMGNFENYNFNLNDNNRAAIANNTALVTVTDTLQNDNTVDKNNGTTTNKSNVTIAGISGGGIVRKGNTFTLIDASGTSSFNGGDNTGNIGGLFNTKTGDTTKDIKVGLVGRADVSYTVDTANNKILATVDDMSVSKQDVMTNVKPLAEGRLAALQNVTRGADLLLDVMGKNKEVGTLTPIFITDGGLYKYDSGSHIRSRDYRTMLGARYQFLDNFYAGLAIEYGRSNYDTYNKFNSAKVNGNGNTHNYGASLFSKYTYALNIGELYADTAFRFGRTSTDFKSHDIITGSGITAKYNSDANYVGGLVGTGFIYALNDTSSFDSSAHYFYDQLRSDSIVIDGDKVNFKRATSSRVQLKERYNYKINNMATLYLGGLYEYEFDSKANVNTAGISINAPSVKGSTEGVELGVKAPPFVKNKALTLNMNVRGYTGKREGGSLSLSVNYDF